MLGKRKAVEVSGGKSMRLENRSNANLKNMLKNSSVNKSSKTVIRRILVNRGVMKKPGRPPALKKVLGVKAFEETGEDHDEAKEVFDDNDEEEDQLMRIIPQELKGKFKATWRALSSKQVYNGSLLEFQGMRFSSTADVYDADRNSANGGRDVFSHIMEYSPKEKIYLKCRFSLEDVNSDENNVSPGYPDTWASLNLKAKGKKHVEPDVIIKIGNTIKIFEMKMGKGKAGEGSTQPKECFQLMRCKRVFDSYLMEDYYGSIPNIELYFVGWSAKSDSEVVFGESKLMTADYSVNKINATGMAARSSINTKLVTAIISELDRKRLKAFNKVVEKFVKPYGKYYNEYRRLVNSHKIIIKNLKNKYKVAINAPPLQIPGTKKSANNVTEKKARAAFAGVMQHPNSNSNSNSENNNAAAKYFLDRLARRGRIPQAEASRTIQAINRSRNEQIKRARTIATEDPEVRRLQAQLKAFSPGANVGNVGNLFRN